MTDYFKQRQYEKIHGKKPAEKKTYRIPAKSKKRIAAELEQKESGKDGALDKFYESARKKMIGKCLFCGGSTEKGNDNTYRRSVAHLFAKRKKQFPSIALNENNWIELCFWKNSCHTQFDTNMITFEDIKNTMPEAWEVIIEKSKILYPLMNQQEQNKVPEIILNEIDAAQKK